MHILSRIRVVILATVAASQPTPAQETEPLPTEQAVRAMLDSGRWFEAARQTNRLAQARLLTGAPLRPDPMLDRLVGELNATYAPGTARILLERAVADPTTSDRARYALLLAESEQVLGDGRGAEETYRRLIADGSQPGGRRQAIIGLARLLLVSRPREALQLVSELISTHGSSADRWEAELIASRAERMLGMNGEAAAHLELASQHAWSAPVGDAAIARVSLDRALAAGLAGDRQSLIAMTAISRNDNQTVAVGQFMNMLPECGLHGIAPADFVVIELVPRYVGGPRLNLIYSSRPEIAAPFLEMISRTPLQNPDGQAMSVLLRCGTSPRAGAIQAWDNPITEWAARIGAYPLMETQDSDEKGRTLAIMAQREARLGPDSPALIPVLTQLLSVASAQSERPPQQAIELQLGYARRLDSLLRTHNASADARLWAALAVATLSAIAVEQPQQTAERLLRSMLQTSAADPALTTETILEMVEFFPEDSTIAPEFKSVLLAQALERLGGSGGQADPRARGLALRLARLKREAGDQSGSAAILRTYNIAADLCSVVETAPRLLSSDIRSEDYPSDAVRGNLRGMVGLDYRLDALGGLHDARIVLAGPPFVFEGPSLDRAPTFRHEPAQSGGAARACRGASERIRWQLP